MNKLTGTILTLPKMSGNVGAKTIYIGGKGDDGATFTPSVSADGIISWTNDKDLPNPEPANIKGPPGVPGATPVKGVDYFDGEPGKDGVSATHSWSGTTLTVTSASGTSSADLKGDPGKDGSPGNNGLSAYQIAQQNGYEGTEAEWLASLQGKPGVSPVKGTDYFTEADKQQFKDDIGRMTSENETPVLGSELASASGWTTTGWTGDFASGFTHTSGNTNALSFAIPGIAVGKFYVIEFDCSVAYTNTNLLVTIGSAPEMLLYGVNSQNTRVGVKAVDTGGLKFTPESAFTGKISNISIREITATSTPRQTIKDSDGNIVSETRNIGENLFVGVGVGGKTVPPSLPGMTNVAIGNSETFQDNISGFWNVAIGTDCMNGNVSGSRNVSIGANNLRESVAGTRNVAIGNFAMAQTKNPNRTVAIGGDCMSTATGSEDNVAVGFSAMYKNTTGTKNVAVGDLAGFNNTTGSYNAFLGAEAGNVNTSGGYNVAAGGKTMYENTTGANNVSIGYTAMYKGANGTANVAVGMAALKGVSGATGVKNNVAIGHEALKNGKTVYNNVAIGQGAGVSLSSGYNNIIIGRGCDLPDGSTYGLNIGDLLKGSTASGSAFLEVNGGLRLASIPPAYSGNSAEVWNNGGVLMVGDGGMETIVQAVISALPVYNGEVG